MLDGVLQTTVTALNRNAMQQCEISNQAKLGLEELHEISPPFLPLHVCKSVSLHVCASCFISYMSMQQAAALKLKPTLTVQPETGTRLYSQHSINSEFKKKF